MKEEWVGVPDPPGSVLLAPLLGLPPGLPAVTEEKLRLGGHLKEWPYINLTGWGLVISSGNLIAFAKEPLKK